MELFNVLTNIDTACASIPEQITNLTSLLYTIVKIAIPLLLIIFGMLDFGRSVIAGDEKEIKEKQKLFGKRLIAAILVFLIFSIVELIITLIVPEGESDSIMGCIEVILGIN